MASSFKSDPELWKRPGSISRLWCICASGSEGADLLLINKEAVESLASAKGEATMQNPGVLWQNTEGPNRIFMPYHGLTNDPVTGTTH